MRFVNENRKSIADNMTYIYFHIEYQNTKDKMLYITIIVR